MKKTYDSQSIEYRKTDDALELATQAKTAMFTSGSSCGATG